MHRDEEEKKKNIISYVKQRKMYKNQIIIKTERAVLCKKKHIQHRDLIYAKIIGRLTSSNITIQFNLKSSHRLPNSCKYNSSAPRGYNNSRHGIGKLLRPEKYSKRAKQKIKPI